jgi:hypothetical protein
MSTGDLKESLLRDDPDIALHVFVSTICGIAE